MPGKEFQIVEVLKRVVVVAVQFGDEGGLQMGETLKHAILMLELGKPHRKALAL